MPYPRSGPYHLKLPPNWPSCYSQVSFLLKLLNNCTSQNFFAGATIHAQEASRTLYCQSLKILLNLAPSMDPILVLNLAGTFHSSQTESLAGR